MEDSTVFVLAAFNRLHKKMNVLYHDYAKSAGFYVIPSVTASQGASWMVFFFEILTHALKA